MNFVCTAPRAASKEDFSCGGKSQQLRLIETRALDRNIYCLRLKKREGKLMAVIENKMRQYNK